MRKEQILNQQFKEDINFSRSFHVEHNSSQETSLKHLSQISCRGKEKRSKAPPFVINCGINVFFSEIKDGELIILNNTNANV